MPRSEPGRATAIEADLLTRRQEEPPVARSDGQTSCRRRDLLLGGAWALVAATGGVAVAGSLRSLFPRASYAPPSRVVLGRPEDFAVGEVSERWKKSHRVLLCRHENGFYALRAVCTHLGCVPGWQPGERQLRCPCHGSVFRADGINISGPAPRPLERLRLVLEEGRLVVDTAIRYRHERGEWDKEGAFLPLRRGGRTG